MNNREMMFNLDRLKTRLPSNLFSLHTCLHSHYSVAIGMNCKMKKSTPTDRIKAYKATRIGVKPLLSSPSVSVSTLCINPLSASSSPPLPPSSSSALLLGPRPDLRT